MDVVRRLERLRRNEHESTVGIVEALIECHRTKAHLDLGHSSLWAFLVDHLKYSNAAASRRYKAMRCALKFPAVLIMLREHRVSLSSLAQVESLLDQIDDPQGLLDRIDGKSQPEVQRLVARERPIAAKPRERVKRRFVKREPVKGLFATSTVEATSAAEPEERVELRFSVPPEQYEAFERARALISRKTGRAPSVEECFRELVDFYVAKKGPKSGAKPAPAGRSRHVPKATRDAVLRRDGERCAFVGRDGRRCGARHNLQIDHVRPFALGGTHDPDNLRVVCAAHNRRRAELTFGDFRRGSRPARE